MVGGVCPPERSCRVLLGFLWMPMHQKEGPASEDKLHEHCYSLKMNSGCSRKPTRTCPALTDSLEPPWRDGKRLLIQDTCLYHASSTWGLEPAAGPEWAQRAALHLPLCKDKCQPSWENCCTCFTQKCAAQCNQCPVGLPVTPSISTFHTFHSTMKSRVAPTL